MTNMKTSFLGKCLKCHSKLISISFYASYSNSRNVFMIWFIVCHKNAFSTHTINGNRFVSISDFTFQVNLWSGGHVTEHDENLAWNIQRPNLHHVGDFIEKGTDLMRHGYFHFLGNLGVWELLWNGQSRTEILILKTLHDWLSPHDRRQADDTIPITGSFTRIILVRAVLRKGGLGLQDYTVTWGKSVIVLNSMYDLPFISKNW